VIQRQLGHADLEITFGLSPRDRQHRDNRHRHARPAPMIPATAGLHPSI
jgi:hypothetical protein